VCVAKVVVANSAAERVAVEENSKGNKEYQNSLRNEMACRKALLKDITNEAVRQKAFWAIQTYSSTITKPSVVRKHQ